MRYYPIQLNLRNQSVLVVGGGPVATHRIEGLLEAGAKVTVVALQVSEAIRSWFQSGKLVLVERALREIDLGGMLLVLAATNDRAANKTISSWCRKRKILCNIADDASLCDFVIPAKIVRGSFMLTVSTEGKSPALAKQVRQELQDQYGPEMEQVLEMLGRKRQDFLRAGQTTLVEKLSKIPLKPLRDLLKEGKKLDALRWLETELGEGASIP